MSGSRSGPGTKPGSRTAHGARPDLRTLPLAVAAVATSWCVTTGQRPPVVAIGLTALVVLVLATIGRRWSLAACAAVTAVLATLGLMRVGALHDSPVHRLAAGGAAVTAVVRISSDPRTLQARGVMPEAVLVQVRTVTLVARGQQITAASPLIVRAGPALRSQVSGLRVGSTVEVRGILTAAAPEDPHAGWLRLTAPPRVMSGPGALDAGVNRIRDALVTSVAHSPPDQRALVPSLVVGDTTMVPETIAEEFRATSLTHLMAVSGANLAATTALLWWVGSWLGMRRRLLRVLSVCGVVGFVIICRSEPSVVRAAAMGVVTLAAVGLAFDRAAGLRALCVAVVGLMIADPWLSRSVGLWLSVSATAGILWWTAGWAAAMASWAPLNLARAVAVPWAAQLATQPIITWLSGQVSTTGLLANLAAAPFVAPATTLGMSAALLGAVWAPLGVPAGWLAGWCVAPILWIARTGAAAPAGALQWPARPVLLVVLGGLCLGIGMITPWLLARRLRALVTAILVVLATVVRPPVPGWPGDWQLGVCDVGQGTAVLVRAGPAAAVLVDTGPEPEPMVRCLDELGVRQVPVLVLTHFHSDHVGGTEAVLARSGVQTVLVSPLASPRAEAQRVLRSAAGAGVRLRAAVPGDTVQVGQVHLEVLWSGPVDGEEDAGSGESSAENNSSVVVRARTPELTAMLTGDIEPLAQQAARRWAEGSGRSLQAQVLVMPHHGSGRQDEAFWRATGARLAIASSGLDNSYGHPAAGALRLAGRLGMDVRRTDQQGTVTVESHQHQVVTRTRR